MERRSFLGMSLVGAAGVTVGATGALAVHAISDISSKGAVGNAMVPFHGTHQSGIESAPPGRGTLVAFDLRDDVDGAALQRLLRLWSTDAALLQAGEPALADAAAELAKAPSSLTVTIGLGWRAFVLAGVQERWPLEVHDIPAYSIDRLEERWKGGDVVLQICANDATAVAHAVRELTRDALPFATVRWQMSGWMPQPDVKPDETPRNLMGFKDGTANPGFGTDVFAKLVWNDGSRHAWFAGGTTMAVRRIRMDLRRWDQVPPLMQESAFGRHMVNGAPLGGTSEYQIPDFAAVDAAANPVIPRDAHVRRAHVASKILRRPFNYDDGYLDDGTPDSGLIFVAYGADIDQYLSIQASLADGDALNRWTTPVGSALFVVPPGAPSAGHWVGETLFAS
jgi:dye decolorizing peroxidase